MKIVTAAEMREIDQITSGRFAVASATLMENAGSAVARFVLEQYPAAERIAVVCGKGNNGGDGLVAARKLIEAGRAVRILLLANPSDLRGDAKTMEQELLRKLHPTTTALLIAADPDKLNSDEVSEIFTADLLLDAILGTGFRPPVTGLYAQAISKMNNSAAKVVAVDIPSGADADAVRPSPDNRRARADAIVTFTAPRPAHVFAELTAGPTVISPIGSPQEAIVSRLNLNLSAPFDFIKLIAPRSLEANKGSYGHVLVIGGSLGKAGAPAMAGFAALRSGAGLVTVATPASVIPTVASFHPELMTVPLPETSEGTVSSRALASELEALVEHKTLAIGPGISRNPETVEFIRDLTLRSQQPMVLDADGLNAFEGASEILSAAQAKIVITPHPGEMSRLTGLSIAEIQANRIEVARRFAGEHNLIVVLKGHRTLIAAPDGTISVNPTGNPGMATGGTGDILTGITAGLLAQHPEHALEAVALGVYLHGLAGDLAAGALGEHSLVATDLIRYLPEAFARVRNSRGVELRIHA
jgi:ADP-dependent NAD(P)H-hydrate dehydratase / NAD(P)H-hydrate epimerase